MPVVVGVGGVAGRPTDRPLAVDKLHRAKIQAGGRVARTGSMRTSALKLMHRAPPTALNCNDAVDAVVATTLPRLGTERAKLDYLTYMPDALHAIKAFAPVSARPSYKYTHTHTHTHTSA